MGGPLSAIVVSFLIVIFAGKHIRRPGPGSHFYVAILTIMEVIVIVIFMYTMKNPIAP